MLENFLTNLDYPIIKFIDFDGYGIYDKKTGKNIENITLENIGDKIIRSTSNMDGVKFYLNDNSWATIRISGTEPLVRIYAESNTNEEVSNIINELKDYIFC